MFSPKSLLPVVALASLATACAVKSQSSLASDSSGSEDVANTEANVESLGASFVGGDGQSLATKSLTLGGGGIKELDTTVSAGNPTARTAAHLRGRGRPNQ